MGILTIFEWEKFTDPVESVQSDIQSLFSHTVSMIASDLMFYYIKNWEVISCSRLLYKSSHHGQVPVYGVKVSSSLRNQFGAS